MGIDTEFQHIGGLNFPDEKDIQKVFHIRYLQKSRKLRNDLVDQINKPELFLNFVLEVFPY